MAAAAARGAGAAAAAWRRCAAVAVFDDGGETLRLSLRGPAEEICNCERQRAEQLEKTLVRITAKLLPKQKGRKAAATEAAPVPGVATSLVVPQEGGEGAARHTVVPGDVPNGTAWTTPGAALCFFSAEGEDPVRAAVVLNPPHCGKVSVMDRPMVGVPQFPVRAELVNCTEATCGWDWLASDAAGENEEQVATGRVYVPREADIGRRLAVRCRPAASAGPPCAAVLTAQSKPSAAPVAALPDVEWRYAPLRRPPQAEAPGGRPLRLCTYNILADAYAGGSQWARENLFKHVDPEALDVAYRSQLLISDLRAMDADLVGLQEVSPSALRSLLPALRHLGYGEPYFAPKTCSEDKQSADGVCLLWRESRLRPVRGPWTSPLALRGGELRWLPSELAEAVVGHPRTAEVFQGVTTTAALGVFEDLQNPGSQVLAAVAHLFYHPGCNHIRLLQSQMLLGELAAVRAECGAHCAAVLMGDLNARKRDLAAAPPCFSELQNKGTPHDWVTPLTKSRLPPQAAYRLLTGSSIAPADLDWEWSAFDWNRAGEPPPVQESELLRLQVDPPLRLRDACPDHQETHVTPLFRECLDYILVDTERMAPVHVPPLPPLERVAADGGGIPSRAFPSDHLPVVADVAFSA